MFQGIQSLDFECAMLSDMEKHPTLEGKNVDQRVESQKALHLAIQYPPSGGSPTHHVFQNFSFPICVSNCSPGGVFIATVYSI